MQLHNAQNVILMNIKHCILRDKLNNLYYREKKKAFVTFILWVVNQKGWSKSLWRRDIDQCNPIYFSNTGGGGGRRGLTEC